MQMPDRAFNRFHPYAVLSYILSVAVISMILRNPIALSIGFALAIASYISFRGLDAWKVVAGVIAFPLISACVNGFFNPLGETVMFTYIGSRPYTFESFAFGFVIGIVFAIVVLWIGVANRTLTSDRYAYIFSRFMPATTLTLTIALRFEAVYERRLRAAMSARSAIGKGIASHDIAGSFRNTLSMLSILVTWAMEKAIVTADSMRSFGYGVVECGRTSYLKIKFHIRDTLLVAATVVFDICSITAIASGAMDADFIPSIAFAGVTPLFLVGTIAYAGMSAMPFAINVAGEASWRVSLSKI